MKILIFVRLYYFFRMIFVTCVSESQIFKRSAWCETSDWVKCVYPAHTAGQVSKFPSPFWVTWNKYWLGPGADQFSGFQPSVSSSAAFLPAEGLIVLNIWGYVCLKHEASTAAASGAPAPPTGPLLWVCHRRRMGGTDGELTLEKHCLCHFLFTGLTV